MNNIIPLPDHRLLAYAEYGDPGGTPIFFFHGLPGSRLYRPPDEITARMGVRLICTDRPGFGLSTFQPGRCYLDWPADILQLADALGIGKFAVAGHSGGGPHVLACAYKIPERLTAAAVLSGAGPVEAPGATNGMTARNALGFRVGRFIPWPLWYPLMSYFYRPGRKHPEKIIKPDEDVPANPDNTVMADPAILENCRNSVREAFRPGMRGHAWEGRLLVRAWGFRLEEISIPVHLWHGDLDRETSIAMGRFMAGSIPHATLHFCPGEGHMLLFPHWEEILTTLTTG